MPEFNEDVFEGTVEIVSSALEETEVELSAKGGEQVADFFAVIYRRLNALITGENDADAAKGAFEVYRDAKEEYRFRLKSSNGQTIAVSEGYKKKDACLRGIASVRKHAPSAELKEE